ncbi:MAG: hypothetical protein ACLFWR_13280 [Acidimicrobiales bacterium]
MTIDQVLRDAGSRLAEMPVEVPELDRLVRHRHRTRSFAMSGAIAVLVVVVAVGIVALDAPSDAPVAADGRRPVTTEAIGLSTTDGIWPNDERLQPTIEETVDAFATDVLGWADASFDVTIRDASGPNWVTVSSGDRSIRMVAAPIDGEWRVIRAGDLDGWSIERTQEQMRVDLPDPPDGAVAARWWVMADSVEHTGTHTELDAPLTVPIEDPVPVGASLVVFLDADGSAIDAIGGEVPPGLERSEPLPTYRLDLPGAVPFSYGSTRPAVAATVVWGGTAERQPHLSLNLRLADSDAAMTPTGFGPMTEDADFPERDGRAWFTTDTGEPVRSLRMWWTRPDGAVWLLTMAWPEAADGIPHADAVDQMRSWALAIEAPESGDVADYRLPLAGVQRLAADERGTIRSEARVWRYRDEEIVLSVSDGGVASGLTNALALDEIERITVDGQLGWRGIDPEGRTVVSWHRPDDDLWARLLIPASLADEVDDIVAALERE